MESIRVLVVDDHQLVLAGICALLQGLEGVEVVAEAGDGREALALVEAHRPEILLTDIAMPEMSGLELAERVTRELPATRVVILSMHATEEYANRALQAGAMGYLLKNSGRRRTGDRRAGRGAGRDLPQPRRLQACHRRIPAPDGRGGRRIATR